MSEMPNLGQRMSRLDEILARLEREDLELEDALALFEEGIGHLREAEKLIRTAEVRVERLLGTPEAELPGEEEEGT